MIRVMPSTRWGANASARALLLLSLTGGFGRTEDAPAHENSSSNKDISWHIKVVDSTLHSLK